MKFQLSALITIIFILIFSQQSFASREFTCSLDDCSDLVALYHFNGNTLDYSGNMHTITKTDSIISANGRFYGGYSFDNVSDLMTIPYHSDFDFTDYATVSMWVKGNAILNTVIQPTTTWETQGWGFDMQVAGDKIYYIYQATDTADTYDEDFFTAYSNLDGSGFTEQQRTSGNMGLNIEGNVRIVGDKAYYLYVILESDNSGKLVFAYSNLDGSNWNSVYLASVANGGMGYSDMQIVGNKVYMVYTAWDPDNSNIWNLYTATCDLDGSNFAKTSRYASNQIIWYDSLQQKSISVKDDKIYYVIRRKDSTCNSGKYRIQVCSSNLDGSAWTCNYIKDCVTVGMNAYPAVHFSDDKIYYRWSEGPTYSPHYGYSNLDGTGLVDLTSTETPFLFQVVGDKVYQMIYDSGYTAYLGVSNLTLGDLKYITQIPAVAAYPFNMQVVGDAVYYAAEDTNYEHLVQGWVNGNLINKGDAFGISLNSSNGASAFANAGIQDERYNAITESDMGATVSSEINNNEWTNIALRYNASAGSLDIFVDGQKTSTAYSTPMLTTGFPITIGNNINATIDELMFFGKYQSDTFVWRLYNMQFSPNYSKFNSTLTTDFVAASVMSAVTNPTLANDYGVSEFYCIVNATDADLNQFVTIKPGVFSLDSSNLNPTWICPTNISIQVNSCTNVKVYYKSGYPTELDTIVTTGQECNGETTPACDNIVCADNVVNFTAYTFSGYGAQGDEEEPPAPVPEFSLITMLIALTTVIAGFFFFRKKD